MQNLWSRCHAERGSRPFSKAQCRKRSGRGNGEGSIFKRQDGGPWYIRWYDHAGKRREHCTKTTDKATAQRILADNRKRVQRLMRLMGLEAVDPKPRLSVAGPAPLFVRRPLTCFTASL